MYMAEFSNVAFKLNKKQSITIQLIKKIQIQMFYNWIGIAVVVYLIELSLINLSLLYATHLLKCHSASDVAKYGTIKYSEKRWFDWLCAKTNASKTLNVAIEPAMISDWPTSRPLIPARMLMALVQKTANKAIYT